MGRDTHIVAVRYVATMIGEEPELIEQITNNSDNIDYGEMIYVSTGPGQGLTAFTARGIESLQEFIADVALGRAVSGSSSSMMAAIPTPSKRS